MRIDFETFKLNNRLKRLEHKVYERAYNKNNTESNAYLVWKFLMDNGPSKSADIKNIFAPEQRASIASVLTNALKDDCIRRQGINLVANPDYNWDDVGVISRSAAQSLNNQLRDAVANAEDDETVQSQTTRATRNTRTPRQPVARAVVPNLFSRRFEEVKAAVDAGQDVNSTDDKGRTPLGWACTERQGNSGQIIRYLLEHGANPKGAVNRMPYIFALLRTNNIDGAKALIEADSDVIDYTYSNSSPLIQAIKLGINDVELLKMLIPEKITVPDVRDIKALFTDLYKTGKLSDNGYSDIIDFLINKIRNHQFSLADNLSDASDFACITDIMDTEFNNGKTFLFDAFVNNGILPGLRATAAMYPRNVQERLFDACEDVCNGVLTYDGDLGALIQTCINIGEKLNKPYDFIYKIITKDWFDENKSTHSSQIENLIDYALFKNNNNILNSIIKVASTSDNAVNYLLRKLSQTYSPLSRQQTILVCRILDKVLSYKYRYDEYRVRDILFSNNDYFLDFILDHPSSKNLIKVIKKFAPHVRANFSRFKPFLTALSDAGYSIDELADEAERSYRANSDSDQLQYDHTIERIVRLIGYDEWERDLDTFLREHPDVLYDERIKDALNDPANAESATGNRIRNMINRLPQEIKDKHTPKYDF